MFGFPNPVNEKAARTVAAGVMVLCVATLVLTLAADAGWVWLTVPLAYGFLARVATGPTLSPLGRLATRVIAPRLGPQRPVAGPPKRFAQGIGATLSLVAVVLAACGLVGVALILVALVLAAATLEAVFGYCLGCRVFAALMRLGVVPAEVCEACNDVGRRLGVV